MSGCTLLATFDDSSPDASVSVHEAGALPLADEAGTEEDASSGDAFVPEPDAGPPTSNDSGAMVTMWSDPTDPPYMLPPDHSPLMVADECNPCADFHESYDSFICADPAAPCGGVGKLSVFFCKGNGTSANQVGYNCPIANPCTLPTPGIDAVCDPCPNAKGKPQVSWSYSNSASHATVCVTCSGTSAQSIANGSCN